MLKTALWWVGSVSFVLITTWLILKATAKFKPIIQGVWPKVEVYPHKKKKPSLKRALKNFLTKLYYGREQM